MKGRWYVRVLNHEISGSDGSQFTYSIAIGKHLVSNI